MTYVILNVMAMRFLATGILVTILSLCLTGIGFGQPEVSAEGGGDNLVVSGLVSNSLNLTYAEVESLPMVSEVASLKCVWASEPQPFVWTGVPLFYLLNLSGVLPNVKEVVFRGQDNFSSSLVLDKAMHPTTILALKVNGTTLPAVDGYPGGLAGGYPYKVVVPCKQGYKWVGWIDEIELVDYDYKGTYESLGFSDEADIPNCTGLPSTDPPYTVLEAEWLETFPVTILSHAAIADAGFNETTKRLYFTVVSHNSSKTLVYIAIPKELITTAFTVFSDGKPLHHTAFQSTLNSFLLFAPEEGLRYVEIKGMLLADVTGSAEGVPDGRVDMLDLYLLATLYGVMQFDLGYRGQYDLNSDSMINMLDLYLTARDYGKSIP